MSIRYDTQDDPVIQVVLTEVAGVHIHIETTRSGKVLLNGALVEPMALQRADTSDGCLPGSLAFDTPTAGAEAP